MLADVAGLGVRHPALAAAMSLFTLLVVVSARPPHKTTREPSPFHHRVASAAETERATAKAAKAASDFVIMRRAFANLRGGSSSGATGTHASLRRCPQKQVAWPPWWFSACLIRLKVFILCQTC